MGAPLLHGDYGLERGENTLGQNAALPSHRIQLGYREREDGSYTILPSASTHQLGVNHTVTP